MNRHVCEHRPVVVAPTFNNARTLLDILRRLDEQGLDVIVTNDGSTDDTAAILSRWSSNTSTASRIVIVHERNRGKAAALASAFTWAGDFGYTHAITIDTDGQLAPEQVPTLLACSQHHPSALVLGTRDHKAADYPRKSFVGRWVSNTLVRWESGANLSDSQCGFRVYPLRIVGGLGCRATRFSFETEVLTRAAWAGVELKQVPVSCTYNPPHGRVTHFKPWPDSLCAVGMHTRLLARAMLPVPVTRLGDEPTGTPWRRFIQWMSPVRAWRAARSDPAERTRFAAGLAAGVFIANLPLYGVQTLLGLATARWFRLHPVAVIAGTHASTPPLGPVLVVAAVSVGHGLMHGAAPTVSHFDPRVIGYAALVRNVIVEWTLGGVVCGAALAAATFVISRVILQWATTRGAGPPTTERMPAALEADAAAPVPVPDS